MADIGPSRQDFPGLFKAGNAALKRLGRLVEFGRFFLIIYSMDEIIHNTSMLEARGHLFVGLR